jgi:asparagine synthase (glutamine-hydrolysing)
MFNACELLAPDVSALGSLADAQMTFRGNVLSEAQALYPNDLARQAMYYDQFTFLCSVLDRNDRMTMAASIECRVPFLDYRLVEMTASLPSAVLFAGFKNKRLLRAALGSRLPAAVLRHRKWGFGVPWKRYLRQVEELRSLLLDLPKAPLLLDSPLDRALIKARTDAFLRGDDQAVPMIMQLMMTVVAWDQARTASPQFVA